MKQTLSKTPEWQAAQSQKVLQEATKATPFKNGLLSDTAALGIGDPYEDHGNAVLCLVLHLVMLQHGSITMIVLLTQALSVCCAPQIHAQSENEAPHSRLAPPRCSAKAASSLNSGHSLQ